MNDIAAVLGMGMISFLFLYFNTTIKDDHYLLKALTVIFFVTSILMLANFMFNGNANAIGTFYKAIVWYVRLFFLYLLGYLIWCLFKKGGWLSGWMK